MKAEQMPLLDAPSSAPAKPAAAVDLEFIRAKMVDVEAFPEPQPWRVCDAWGSKRWDHVGQAVAVIRLRHSPGYEIVLQFPDGKLESFGPHALCPP